MSRRTELQSFCDLFAKAGFSCETYEGSGSASEREDRLVLARTCTTVGVLDGVSKSWRPSEGPPLIDGMKDAEFVVSEIDGTVRGGTANTLSELIESANLELGHKLHGLTNAIDVTDLPGAVGAFARFDLGSDTVEIVAWGDSFAAWRTWDGTIHVSRNQVKRHEAEVTSHVAGCMLRCQGNRIMMFEEHVPWVRPLRQKRINNRHSREGFGLLNGQPEFPYMLQRFWVDLHELRTLVLFTDGMIPKELLLDEHRMAEAVVSQVEHGVGGLARIAQSSMQRAKAEASVSIVAQPEATAIALWR